MGKLDFGALIEAMGWLINSDQGAWNERKTALLESLDDEGKATLEEFVSWFGGSINDCE